MMVLRKRDRCNMLPDSCGYTCIVPICTWNPWRHLQPDPRGPFAAHTVAELAARMERCVVFSAIKATINLEPEHLLSFYFNIFDNIAQKGFRKIIVYYGSADCIDFETVASYFTQYSGKSYKLYHVKPLSASFAECINQDETRTESEVTTLIETDIETECEAAVRWRYNTKKEAEHLASIIRNIKVPSDNGGI